MKDNYDELNIYTFNEKKNLKFDGLRYITFPKVNATYDVCTYSIQNPPGGFDGGNIYLKLINIDTGLKMYISSSNSSQIYDRNSIG